VKGDHQILVGAGDIPKTAIIMSFGQFEHLFTPFGLSSSEQTFQRMMDHVVSKLEAVIAYMDDSWVGSPNRQTHLIHLEGLFTAMDANGLAINLENLFLLF
jgi:hypothetical protein